MPILEGVDLTSVSTKREPLPAYEDYLFTIIGQEYDKKQLVVKMRVEEPREINGVNVQGREHWEYINLVKNDGKPNQLGWTTVKRFMEAVFGEGSAEAETNPPDTDQLDGHQVRGHLVINEYKPSNWKEGDELSRNNKIKKLFPA